MSFSFTKFTPSSAGQATSYILDIAKYLAEQRAKNNAIAAANFEISADGATGNANASAAIAQNESDATRAGAWGLMGSGIGQFSPEVIRFGTFLATRSAINTTENNLQNIQSWDRQIKTMAAKPVRGVTIGPNRATSLLKQLDPQFDFTKPVNNDLNAALQYAAKQKNPRTGAPIAEYKAFTNRLRIMKRDQQRILDDLKSDKRTYNDIAHSLGTSTGTMLQAGMNLRQAQIQANNAINQSGKVYYEFVQNGYRSIMDMIYKLGDALESSRQSLIQTLLGGLGSANRA